MSYVDRYSVAVDSNHVLRQQVSVAMHEAAQDVITESPGTPNHANRLVWARRTTGSDNGPVEEAGRWIWMVLENSSIQANPLTSTDNDVQFVVNGLVDTFADR